MDISTGFLLKSEEFQLTDFSKTASFKVRTLFPHLWLVGFYGPCVIAHACALTRCTDDINPAKKKYVYAYAYMVPTQQR